MIHLRRVSILVWYYALFTSLLMSSSNNNNRMMSMMIPVDAFMAGSSARGLMRKGMPVRLKVQKEVVQNVTTTTTTTSTTTSAASASSTASATVTNRLNEYMQLPAAQYACVPMPLNSSLKRIYGSVDEFLLEVPQVSFTLPNRGNIDVIPQIKAKVQVESDKVIIQSISCTISGSPIVETWKLNDRYDLDVKVILTWGRRQEDGEEENTILSISDTNDDGDQKNDNNDTDGDTRIEDRNKKVDRRRRRSRGRRNIVNNNNNNRKRNNDKATTTTTTIVLQQEDAIRAMANLEVDVYPPRRFRVIPRRLLARAGNMAMSYIVGLLLENFLEGLESDYQKWSMDPEYRMERKRLEQQLQQEIESLKKQQQQRNSTKDSNNNRKR
eukprot:scaffold1427_cov63-Cylindrotheca_fusiformis.AAC.2